MGPLAIMGIQAGVSLLGGLLAKKPKFKAPKIEDTTPAVLAANQIGDEKLAGRQEELIHQIQAGSAGTVNIPALQKVFAAGNEAARDLDNRTAVMLRDAANDRIRRKFEADMMRSQLDYQSQTNRAQGVFGLVDSANSVIADALTKKPPTTP